MIQGASCGECVYFAPHRDVAEMPGTCRLAPPGRKGWPEVGVGEWCGEFTLTLGEGEEQPMPEESA